MLTVARSHSICRHCFAEKAIPALHPRRARRGCVGNAYPVL